MNVAGLIHIFVAWFFSCLIVRLPYSFVLLGRLFYQIKGKVLAIGNLKKSKKKKGEM